MDPPQFAKEMIVSLSVRLETTKLVEINYAFGQKLIPSGPQTGMILGYSAAGELVRPTHVYDFFFSKGVFSPWRSTRVNSMLDHHVELRSDMLQTIDTVNLLLRFTQGCWGLLWLLLIVMKWIIPENSLSTIDTNSLMGMLYPLVI